MTKKTGKNISLNKISLGNPENKTSGKFSYEMTPVLYDKKPFEIVECGKMKIFSFNNKSFSIGITIDKENEDYFKSIERRISDLYDIQKFMQNFLRLRAKLLQQSEFYQMEKRKLSILPIILEFHFQERL